MDPDPLAGLLLLGVMLGLYLLPAIVAKARGKRDYVAILALNLLSGWTGLGWAAALVWALTQDPQPQPRLRRRNSGKS